MKLDGYVRFDFMSGRDERKIQYITDGQISRLWAIARSNGYRKDEINAITYAVGYNDLCYIPVEDYEHMCSYFVIPFNKRDPKDIDEIMSFYNYNNGDCNNVEFNESSVLS